MLYPRELLALVYIDFSKTDIIIEWSDARGFLIHREIHDFTRAICKIIVIDKEMSRLVGAKF